jgi:hypothetical protein
MTAKFETKNPEGLKYFLDNEMSKISQRYSLITKEVYVQEDS